MLTDHAATVLFDPPPGRPLFEGSFSIVRSCSGLPLLFISFKCPHCRKMHHHRWDVLPGFALDWDRHGRAPHCASAALRHGYEITPAPTDANRRVYREYAELLRRAEQHQAPAAGPADARDALRGIPM